MSEVLRGQDVATNHFIFSASCVQQTKTGNRNQIKVINLHPQNETMHLSDDKKTHQTFAKYQIEDKSSGFFFLPIKNPNKLHCGVWQSLNTSEEKLFVPPTFHFISIWHKTFIHLQKSSWRKRLLSLLWRFLNT